MILIKNDRNYKKHMIQNTTSEGNFSAQNAAFGVVCGINLTLTAGSVFMGMSPLVTVCGVVATGITGAVAFGPSIRNYMGWGESSNSKLQPKP